MKTLKLILVIFFIPTLSVYSQYTEVWNINEEFTDLEHKPYRVSKIRIADNGTIYTALSNASRIPHLAGANPEGNKLFSFTNNVSRATAVAQNDDRSLVFYVDESFPNKFLLQESSLFLRYYNLLKSDQTKETYSYPITALKSLHMFYNTHLLSKLQNLRSYTTVFDKNHGLCYADTVWLGHVVNGR